MNQELELEREYQRQKSVIQGGGAGTDLTTQTYIPPETATWTGQMPSGAQITKEGWTEAAFKNLAANIGMTNVQKVVNINATIHDHTGLENFLDMIGQAAATGGADITTEYEVG